MSDDESMDSVTPRGFEGLREVHMEEDPRGPSCRGTLYKKSKGLWGRGATWAERMFVLEERSLSYHVLAKGANGQLIQGSEAEIDLQEPNKESRKIGIKRATDCMPIAPKHGPTPYRFRVWHTKKSYWDLCANTEAERQEWLEALSHARRPVWKPSQNASKCRCCATKFSVITRRHHCRECGENYCGTCTPEEWQRPLVELGYKGAVRVCRGCYSYPPNGSGYEETQRTGYNGSSSSADRDSDEDNVTVVVQSSIITAM